MFREVHGGVCREFYRGVYGEVHIGLLGWLQGGVPISAISNSFEILNVLTTIHSSSS